MRILVGLNAACIIPTLIGIAVLFQNSDLDGGQAALFGQPIIVHLSLTAALLTIASLEVHRASQPAAKLMLARFGVVTVAALCTGAVNLALSIASIGHWTSGLIWASVLFVPGLLGFLNSFGLVVAISIQVEQARNEKRERQERDKSDLVLALRSASIYTGSILGAFFLRAPFELYIAALQEAVFVGRVSAWKYMIKDTIDLWSRSVWLIFGIGGVALLFYFSYYIYQFRVARANPFLLDEEDRESD